MRVRRLFAKKLQLKFVFFREIHREQISLEHSTQDFDSAVGRLDNILISIYVVVAILIIAVALVSQSFLMFSVWRSSSLFFLGSSASYSRDWCWHLHPRFVLSVYSVVDIKSLAFLGLSWLVGGSLQEVLSSIIFLFIKYPFDVGDHVILNKEAYTVKEIGLLSTIFLDSTSSVVQVPNSVLNTLVSFKSLTYLYYQILIFCSLFKMPVVVPK